MSAPAAPATVAAMTVLLAAVGAIVIATAIAAAVSGQRRSRQLAVERTLVEQLRAQLGSEAQARAALQEQATAASDRASTAAEHAAAAEQRAAEADARAADADARATEADARAAEAEVRAAEADRQAGEAAEHAAIAERRADDAGARTTGAGAAGGSGPNRPERGSAHVASPGLSTHAPKAPASRAQAQALWHLERIRLEREWREIAGPSAPLPVPWDGTVGAALAVELELIREIIGTPSRLEIGAGHGIADPVAATSTARIAGELLRCLARTGEELVVTMVGPSEVRVAVAVEPGAGSPDVEALARLASAAGGTVEVSADDEGLQALVTIPTASD